MSTPTSVSSDDDDEMLSFVKEVLPRAQFRFSQEQWDVLDREHKMQALSSDPRNRDIAVRIGCDTSQVCVSIALSQMFSEYRRTSITES